MNKNKRYTSFEEIDRDLKQLQLQSEINKEELKLGLNQAKSSVTPSSFFGNALGGLASSGLLIKLLTPVASYGITKLLSRLGRKK